MVEPSVGIPPLSVGVYPKAQVLNRFVAKFVDAIIVIAASKLVTPVGWLAGLAYILIADGFSGGRSIGKRLVGLQTVIPRTQQVSGFKESIIRNLPLALSYLLCPVPYIGWLAATAILALESLLLIGNDQGLRLGDDFAKTQVLDGGQLDLRD
ncbi:MAG: RDD family protein [Nitrospiraceae bacterium]